MIRRGFFRLFPLVLAALLISLLTPSPVASHPMQGSSDAPSFCQDDGPKPKRRTKKKRKRKGKKKGSKSGKSKKKKGEPYFRWGQRRTESDKKYDKRYKRMLKRAKQDKRGDFSGGHFVNSKDEKIRLWNVTKHPFICRSDIDAKFTVDLAMYMEMLHREYQSAYSKLLGASANVKEKIEVIVFADRATYMKNGGVKGSGGFFHPAVHVLGDRGPFWPARHYRLVQFTSGVTDFAKWPKGTLKHEAAHMELQLRLGYTLFYGMRFGIPVGAPNWWNEGQATVFEYWDFGKTTEENFAEIPDRGRYAPVIRRIHDTDRWKDFHYVWTIDPATWHKDMTSSQGFLNYAQAWSLAAYMMNEGRKGRQDFRRVFDLSKRVGVDQQTTYKGDRKIAWTEKFPEEAQAAIEKRWSQWVADNVSRDKRVPDEEWFLKRQGFKPDVLDHLETFSSDEWKEMREQIQEESERRKEEIEIEK